MNRNLAFFLGLCCLFFVSAKPDSGKKPQPVKIPLLKSPQDDGVKKIIYSKMEDGKKVQTWMEECSLKDNGDFSCDFRDGRFMNQRIFKKLKGRFELVLDRNSTDSLTREYDEEGNLLKEVKDYCNGQLYTTTIMEYDNKNNITKKEVQGKFGVLSVTVYENKNDGEIVIREYEDGVARKNLRRTGVLKREFDKDGNLCKETESWKKGEDKEKEIETEFSHKKDLLVKKVIRMDEYYDWGISKEVLTETYKYDNQNRLIEYVKAGKCEETRNGKKEKKMYYSKDFEEYIYDDEK